MSVYFSGSRLCFIPSEWRNDGTYSIDTWPEDAVELTEGEIESFWKASPPYGKQLGSSTEGRPIWVDIPPPSHGELVVQAGATKSSLQREAEDVIKPLERAKQLGIATDSEMSSLTEWERYSVFLMRVDTSLAPNIEWPQKPQ